jgi:hypothetical protein
MWRILCINSLKVLCVPRPSCRWPTCLRDTCLLLLNYLTPIIVEFNTIYSLFVFGFSSQLKRSKIRERERGEHRENVTTYSCPPRHRVHKYKTCCPALTDVYTDTALRDFFPRRIDDGEHVVVYS